MKQWRPPEWEKTLRDILDRFNVTYMNSEEGELVEAVDTDAVDKQVESPISVPVHQCQLAPPASPRPAAIEPKRIPAVPR